MREGLRYAVLHILRDTIALYTSHLSITDLAALKPQHVSLRTHGKSRVIVHRDTNLSSDMAISRGDL